MEHLDDEKMSRSLKNGVVGVGRKLLMASFVLSSAPLVVPPLAVISAVGVVLWVPCGVLLASYVCTQKLMSKLIPDAVPPLHSFLPPYHEDESGNFDLIKQNDEEDGIELEFEYTSERQPEISGGEDDMKPDGTEVEDQNKSQTREAVDVPLVLLDTKTTQHQGKTEDGAAASRTDQQISNGEKHEFNHTRVSSASNESSIQTDGTEQKVEDQNRRDDNQIEPTSAEFAPPSKLGEAKDTTDVQPVPVDTTKYEEKAEDRSAPLDTNKQVSEGEEHEFNHVQVSSASNEQTGGQAISSQLGSKGEKKKKKNKTKRKTDHSGSGQ